MNQSAATIRSLVIDTINSANSGHLGMALGSAPALYQLFNHNLITTQRTVSGSIEIDLFLQPGMHLLCFILFFTCLDSILLSMI